APARPPAPSSAGRGVVPAPGLSAPPWPGGRPPSPARAPRRELGRALVGKHDPAAISELAAAVRDDPSDAQAHYYLGVALLQADRPADAAQSLERARQLDSTFWGTWFYLGKTRLKQTDTAG